MKRPCTLLAALLLHRATALCAGADPVASVRWDAETSDSRPIAARVPRGESLVLEARLLSYRKPLALPAGAEATFCWQTNGMGEAWWTAPASARTNGTLRTVWTPEMDAGADEYVFFLRVVTEGGIDYSARGGLRVLPSPGVTPNEIPFPVRTLDFSTVAVTNAPWIAAESDPSFADWVATTPLYTSTQVDVLLAGKLSAADLTNATTTAAGLMSAADKEKLDNIQPRANNSISSIDTGSDMYSFGENQNILNVRGIGAVLAVADASDSTLKISVRDGWFATNGNYQAAIADLNEIRAGAAAGATAVRTEADPTIALTNGTLYVHGETITPLTEHQTIPAETDPIALPLIAAAALAATNYTDAAVAAATFEPDPVLTTNLVAESAAQILANAPDAAAWTALKLIVADLWRRVDALDADGSDALSAAAAEQLINDRIAQMYASLDLEFADWRAQQTSTCYSTTISANTSGVAAQLSPVAATRYYASSANDITIGFSSFSGVGNLPCILILERFSSVSWPTGAKVEPAYGYNSGNPNVYAIYKLNGTLYAKKIYQ